MKFIVKAEGTTDAGKQIRVGKVVDTPEAAVAFISNIVRVVK